jgi:uncharacterized protein (DUF3084 family)
MRTLAVFLLGLFVGAAGMGYLVGSGAGDLIIRRTESVQELQRRLGDSEQQRDQLRRQLDDVVGRAGRMEASFADLEHRFKELQQQLDQPHGGHAAQ